MESGRSRTSRRPRGRTADRPTIDGTGGRRPPVPCCPPSAGRVAMNGDGVEAFVRPFAGGVYCHAPTDRPFDLNALARKDDGEDRWSSPGTSSIYLAGDPLVA